jgi:hypothetical protein
MLALCNSLVVQAAANDMLPDHNIRQAFIKQRSSLEEALGKKKQIVRKLAANMHIVALFTFLCFRIAVLCFAKLRSLRIACVTFCFVTKT